MNLFKKYTLVILSICASSFVVSAPDSDSRLKELERKMDKVYTKTVSGSEGAQTASARPDNEGSGFFVFFDVTYWQAKTNTNGYAVTSNSYVDSPITLSGQQARGNFDWDWGFKAGLGINFDHDAWDIKAGYTYFSTNANDMTSVESPSVIFPQLGDGILRSLRVAIGEGMDICSKATADVSIDYDNINLDLGRNYFVSKSLSLRPAVGLQSTWIKTVNDVAYTGGNDVVLSTSPSYTLFAPGVNTIHVKERSRFWGMGPKLSLDTKWYLTNGFSVFGNGSTSLLYGIFHNLTRNWYSANLNRIDIKDNFHGFVPNLNLILGLSYDKYIYNDAQHIGVSLGYETQFYWNANQSVRIVDDQSTRYSNISEDVSFRGVTLDIRWDF